MTLTNFTKRGISKIGLMFFSDTLKFCFKSVNMLNTVADIMQLVLKIMTLASILYMM